MPAIRGVGFPWPDTRARTPRRRARPARGRSQRRSRDPRASRGSERPRCCGMPRGRPPACAIAEVEGVQAEMELPFAGIHQLCAPMLDAARGARRAAAERAPRRVGRLVGRRPGQVPRRRRRAQPACRDRRGATAPVSGGRRAVARRRLGSGARIRRAAPAGRTGGDDVLAARADHQPRARRPARS